MKLLVLLIVLSCIILFSFYCAGLKCVEGFRGRRRRGGRRGRRRRRIARNGRGGRGGRYLHRFRRRGGRWNSPYWFNYSYIPFWYDYAPTWYEYVPNWYDFWPLAYPCKKGCTPEGCAVPGNGIDECVWASDCWGC